MVNSGSEFIVTKCPNCGQGFKVDSQWSGKKATCQKCRKQFVITISKRETDATKCGTHKSDRTEVICTKCEKRIEKSEIYRSLGQELFCRECHSQILPGQLKQMTLIANYLAKKDSLFLGSLLLMVASVATVSGFIFLREASWIFAVLGGLFFAIALKERLRPDRWGPLIIGAILFPLGIMTVTTTIVSIQNYKEASRSNLFCFFSLLIILRIALWVCACVVGFSLLRDRKKWQEGLAVAADNSLVQQVRKALKDCEEHDFIQFRVPGIPDKHWRIYLDPNYALLSCLSLRGTKHFFITKEEFSIRTKKDILVLSGIKIEIQLDQTRLVGYMSKKDMDRFNNWKNQNTGLQSEKKESTT